MKNNNGFSLVEIILALCISAIGFSIAILFFQINHDTLTARETILTEENGKEKIKRMQDALSNGYINQENKVKDGIIATPKELKFQTTYFSKDVANPDIYTISCQENKIFNQLNDTQNKEVFSNVNKCGFRYFDTQMNETNKLEEIVMVEFYFSYKTNHGEKEFIIRRKLMQTM